MTSKNSFWVSVRENQKRRIWVWISAFLIQLILAVGTLTVYLSRIMKWNENGVYATKSVYKTAMCEAARDALSFNTYQWFFVILLAMVIGMQGFSYLNDRRKVDLYHSVPVSRKSRFWVIYTGGIAIYVLSSLVSLVLGIGIAASMGAADGKVIAATGLAFLWNFLFFLVMYHAAMFAVMLTGNWFVTILVFAFLAVYEAGIYYLLDSFKSAFFRTASSMYVTTEPKLSALSDYINMLYPLKYGTADIGGLLKTILPYCGKWIMIAIGLLVVTYLLYCKRASEAAGRAIAYRKVEPVLKVAAAIPLASLVGITVYQASCSSKGLMVVSMIVSGMLFCGVAEILFDFDLRSAVHHLISTGVAFIGILAVFFIINEDLLGYDKYVPRADQVESIALQFDCDYMDYYRETSTGMEYIDNGTYQKEYMHITDVEPVLAMAEKSLKESNWEDMKEGCHVNVLYRMKSGRQVERGFSVDFANPVNEGYLNEIVGSKEYKEGVYQTMTQDSVYDLVGSITYSNGVTQMAVPTGDIQKIRKLWNEDMMKADFTMFRGNYPCGVLNLNFAGSYMSTRLPVYENFTNTIAYLKEQGAYYPVKLNVEDIESITVTNYHNEYYEMMNEEAEEMDMVTDSYYSDDTYVDVSRQAEFRDEKEIEEILKGIYPAYVMNTGWNGYDAFDSNYDVQVVFKADSSYPYQRGGYYFAYQFLNGKVPGFVAEATALD